MHELFHYDQKIMARHENIENTQSSVLIKLDGSFLKTALHVGRYLLSCRICPLNIFPYIFVRCASTAHLKPTVHGKTYPLSRGFLLIFLHSKIAAPPPCVLHCTELTPILHNLSCWASWIGLITRTRQSKMPLKFLSLKILG